MADLVVTTGFVIIQMHQHCWNYHLIDLLPFFDNLNDFINYYIIQYFIIRFILDLLSLNFILIIN